MTTSQTTPTTGSPDSGERADLLEALGKHRDLFRGTVRGLTDEQAASRPTASELCLGGLIKHVTATEREWADFVTGSQAPAPDVDWATIDWSNPPAAVLAYQQQFQMLEGETLTALLLAYDEVATHVDSLVRDVDLAVRHPLPDAPWFESGSTWSNRRVFLHLIAEVSQHAGHADILRETIDGQKSMG